MKLTLKEAMKLIGVENWKLTPSQKKYLINSTNRLLEKHPEAWFKENQEHLKRSLKLVFNEI